jgi:GGDEF domain-containing protein
LLKLAVPLCILVAAWFLVPVVSALPEAQQGLKLYGAYAVLALGAIVGLAFRRGRVVFGLLTLALAYAGYARFAHRTPADFDARTVLVAACIFVPLNLAGLSVLRERGIFNIYGMQRFGVIVAETVFVLWVLWGGRQEITAWAYLPLISTQMLAASPMPQLGLAAMALSLVVSAGAWIVRDTPTELAFASAILAYVIGIFGLKVPQLFPVFIAAGGLIFTIAVLQETFRMAFRDDLTGLASRRDLNESLMGLGGDYTIAMLDVDHFKKFNDTYGHDLGDQILKMVGTKIDAVGGGGRAYRYGGEEFTVLFPGEDLAHAMPHLEALREQIESYQLALRAPDRPPDPKDANRHAGGFRAAKSVSVTISIGIAETSDKLATPEDVIKAADKALYRAKKKGRNRISR